VRKVLSTSQETGLADLVLVVLQLLLSRELD
jgi:hypothetical protein